MTLEEFFGKDAIIDRIMCGDVPVGVAIGSTVEECAERARLFAVASSLLLQLQRLERVVRDTIDADGALIIACDNARSVIALATAPASAPASADTTTND